MECENCGNHCSQEERFTERAEDQKKEINRRLNIIEGQVRGIKQMIADDRYCDDVLIQISAIDKSLKSLGNYILENHLKTCVAYDVQIGNLDILDEVMLLIKKLQ